MKNDKTLKPGWAGVLPLLPMRDLTVLPGSKTPLLVGRPKSIRAVERAYSSGGLIMLCGQKNPKLNDPGPGDIHAIGCVARVSRPRSWPDGALQTSVEGIARARIVRFEEGEDLFLAAVEPLEEPQASGGEALLRAAKGLLEKYAGAKSSFPREALAGLLAMDNPSAFADALAEKVIASALEKQAVLEAAGVRERMRMVIEKIQMELEILELEKSVRGRVKKQMEKTQRDYYLTEQMKAIQRELGRPDGEKSEIEELAARITAARMPKEVEEKAFKELGRLEQTPPQSAEGTVVRNYLDWLVEVPWKKRTKENLDVAAAEKVLDGDHYGLAKIKERIAEFLAVRSLAPETRGPILCFVGPPGVGKTSLGRSIAHAMGRKFIRFSLGGVRDEAEIRGHRRTYIGSMPGRIIQGMKKAGVKNPVMMLDEVDKLSSDYRGDPSAALLEALDPEQNKSFSDHYLEVDYDLSEVMFITTANSLAPIPKPLRDRMEVISLPGYNDEEKIQIAGEFLVPRQLKEHGLSHGELKFSQKALWEIIRNHTREAGVRELERCIAKVCRKRAREVVKRAQSAGKPGGKGKTPALALTPGRITEYLGESNYREETAEKRGGVGLATALAWTESGGALLKIETTILEGRGKFILTGKLGEVMKESAHAALSYIRSRAGDFGLEKGFHGKIDIHIHIPEGATPKDGPSAGAAMCVSMLSALLNVPARGDVAMTGEITLRGNIIMIGGLREKLLAARRAGIKTALIPAENARELSEVSETVKKKLHIIPVEHMDQALGVALEREPRASGGTRVKSAVANRGPAALN